MEQRNHSHDPSGIRLFLLNAFFIAGLITVGSWVRGSDAQIQPIIPKKAATALEASATTTIPISQKASVTKKAPASATPTTTTIQPLPPPVIRYRGDDDGGD